MLEHGLQVQARTHQLIEHLRTGAPLFEWRLPEWVTAYREQLLSSLVPQHVIDEYTVYHDCGKPYCVASADRKFPDHAERSYETWLNVGGNTLAAELMRLDMCIHTMSAKDVEEFCSHVGAATLLLVGLAEIHANADMFGGIGSQSFKIKWKQIDRRGRAVCARLFGGSHA